MERIYLSRAKLAAIIGGSVFLGGAIAGFIGAATSSAPSTGPSIRTEELIFEECLRQSQTDYPSNQPMVVRECRVAAAQMVGRIARTQ